LEKTIPLSIDRIKRNKSMLENNVKLIGANLKKKLKKKKKKKKEKKSQNIKNMNSLMEKKIEGCMLS